MKIYMIGIKGSGMAALAHILIDDRYEVSGEDVPYHLQTEDDLIKREVKIYPFCSMKFLETDLIIIGHSFYNEKITNLFDKYHLPYLEYNKFINFYFKHNNLVCISGSHGKTTLVKLFADYTQNCSYLIGDGHGHYENNSSYTFLEACEYKKHFLAYFPRYLIITNVDYDHSDYFKNEKDYFNAFKEFIKRVPIVFIEEKTAKKLKCHDAITYGESPRADYQIKNYEEKKDFVYFDIFHYGKSIAKIKIKNYGKYYSYHILSMVAFFDFTNNLKLLSMNNLENFVFPMQRYHEEKIENYVFITDYAHHPHQMEANYEIVKKRYPNYTTFAFYKPDRESRIVCFKNAYKRILSKYDYCFLIPYEKVNNLDELITKKIEFYDLQKLIELIKSTKKCIVLDFMTSKNIEKVLDEIKKEIKNISLSLK